MKHLILFIIAITSFTTQAQHPEEFLDMQGIKYIKHTSNQTVEKDKKATVLITACVPDTKGLFQTLKNNPQIEELYLANVDQNLLNIVLQLTDTKITKLNIDNFQSESCLIPACKMALTEFQLFSEDTKTIEVTPNAFPTLQIFHVEMNNLTEWKGELNIPSLGLLDVDVLSLEKLPKVTAPILDQYSFSCSAPVPMDICDMPNVLYFNFSTTLKCELSPCHEEILKRVGLIEFVSFSEDEEKRTSIKSQELIDFEKEMEEENQKMMEEMNNEQKQRD